MSNSSKPSRKAALYRGQKDSHYWETLVSLRDLGPSWRKTKVFKLAFLAWYLQVAQGEKIQTPYQPTKYYVKIIFLTMTSFCCLFLRHLD